MKDYHVLLKSSKISFLDHKYIRKVLKTNICSILVLTNAIIHGFSMAIIRVGTKIEFLVVFLGDCRFKLLGKFFTKMLFSESGGSNMIFKTWLAIFISDLEHPNVSPIYLRGFDFVLNR